MPKRYEPTAEMLANILKWYKETKNYTEVSRRTGLTVLIVKRIITENSDRIPVIYNGLPPKERQEYSFDYHQYYSELKKLSEELRNNNGVLQD